MMDNIPGFFRKRDYYCKHGNYEIFAQEFMYSIVYGNLNTLHLKEILEALNLPHQPNYFLLLRIDEDPTFRSEFPDYDTYPIKMQVMNAIEGYLEINNIRGVAASFLGRNSIGCALYLHLKSEATCQIDKPLRSFCENFSNYVKSHSGHSVSMSISDECKDINAFKSAYVRVKRAFRSNFNKGKGEIIFHDDECDLSGSVDPHLLLTTKHHLISAIDQLSYESYSDSTENYIHYMKQNKVDPLACKRNTMTLISSIYDHYNQYLVEKYEMITDYMNVLQVILNAEFLETVKKGILGFGLSTIHRMEEYLVDPLLPFQHFVTQVLNDYYADEDFSLRSIAKLYGYSTNYFGRKFRHVFGCPFHTALNNTRIDRAKELLLLTNHSIDEIAHLVGFRTCSYFIKLYHANTGMTPSTARKLLRKTENAL